MHEYVRGNISRGLCLLIEEAKPMNLAGDAMTQRTPGQFCCVKGFNVGATGDEQMRRSRPEDTYCLDDMLQPLLGSDTTDEEDG